MFRKYAPALVLTFGLFVLWGVGHRLYDTLVPDFAKAFGLNSGQLVLTQSVYDIVYFILAMPAAVYARTLGSKAAIVFGLGSLAVGAFLFYPAAHQHTFLCFLFAAAVMSCGYIFLEIAANPVISQMGPPETATRRLNFAHALYPVGVFIAIYVGRWIILSNLALPLAKLADAVVTPYMVLGGIVLALAFIVDHTPFPAGATQRGRGRAAMGEFRKLLSKPLFLAAVGAQFANVAGQAGTWTLADTYVKAVIPTATNAIAADYLLAALIVFGIARFIGAILMFWFNPDRMLVIFAGSGVVLATVAAVAGNEIGIYAMVASNVSASILFATILGAAIRNLGPLTHAGTALAYMGSAAGAAAGIATMHLVWTVSSIQIAMIVPVAGYLGVTVFALANRRAAGNAPSIANHAAA